MGTGKSSLWSELPMNVLGYLLERLSYFEFHMAKMVCSNWYLCSKQTLRPKFGSPLLFLSLEEGGCRLYSPEEDKFYETNGDFSGYRFLASSGKWFLVVDSRSDLYIVHVFSEVKIPLPPLESIKGGLFKVERAGDDKFNVALIRRIMHGWYLQNTKHLRGLLWVDDKTCDYVVVWQFEEGQFLGFCKNGDDHYRDIPIEADVRREFRGLKDVVLKGYSLYYLATRDYVRHLDLSGQDDFKDVSGIPRFPMWKPYIPTVDYDIAIVRKFVSRGDRLAVTTLGEVLLVYTQAYEPICEGSRLFCVYKRDLKELDTKAIGNVLLEVESIGDEAFFFDLGITVPADHTLGIEPNSIYFTRTDRFGHGKFEMPCIDICVYNIKTKTIKRFPSLSDLKLKDAQWFLPA